MMVPNENDLEKVSSRKCKRMFVSRFKQLKEDMNIVQEKQMEEWNEEPNTISGNRDRVA